MVNPDPVRPKILSVSQLNYYVKSVLESDPHLGFVIVSGEISNLTDHYRSGHIYFSLKDEKAVVRSVMFSGSASRLKFRPEEGMKVLAMGRISLYETSGSYQLYVEDMQPDGIGALTQAYEQLKKKLEAKGLFSAEHKKPVPQFPKTVGVITSPTGAVIRDIQNVISRRFPNVEIVLCPVLVQGENAAPQLIRAVNLFNDYDLADVIIIGRGGGSIEDLWPFNDENLAYAIYASNIPVISAVGHETDFTICDFVSDLRAPTPSAAAELAVPDREELRAYYDSQVQYLRSITDSNLNSAKSKLKASEAVVSFNSPERLMKEKLLKLNNYERDIADMMNNSILKRQNDITNLSSALEALNPLSVLSRGYSIAWKENKLINSVKEIKPDDLIKLTLKDGEILTKVQG